jgi:hypothetical protein
MNKKKQGRRRDARSNKSLLLKLTCGTMADANDHPKQKWQWNSYI